MNQSFLISFFGEGSTDNRFFSTIIQRIIEEYFFEKGINGKILWQPIDKKGSGLEEQIVNAALKAKYSNILILHSDSDGMSMELLFKNKFENPLTRIHSFDNDKVCKNIVLLIPIIETEAWMLVDLDLLKSEINTTLSNKELGLVLKESKIESINDPKRMIENAILIHKNSLSRKRRRYSANIDELYETVGQRIELGKLEILGSYRKFKDDLYAILENIL